LAYGKIFVYLVKRRGRSASSAAYDGGGGFALKAAPKICVK